MAPVVGGCGDWLRAQGRVCGVVEAQVECYLPSLGCYRVRVKAVLLIQHCGGATGTCGTWFSNIASKIMGIGPGGVCIILISDDLIVSFARDLKR